MRSSVQLPSASKALPCTVAGEDLLVLGDRTAYWPSREVLFVADVHLGKAASYRAASIPLPHGTSDLTFSRLSNGLGRNPVKTLVLLGDLWHDPRGRTLEIETKLCEWLEQWPNTDVILVTGNHDRRSGPILPNCRIIEMDDLQIGPFVCRHHPEADSRGYVLCGHLHPAVRLSGRGDSIMLPCFWFGREVAVIPAFGEFTGTAEIKPNRLDQVFVVAQEQVFRVSSKP